jgi:hypothetical protein
MTLVLATAAFVCRASLAAVFMCRAPLACHLAAPGRYSDATRACSLATPFYPVTDSEPGAAADAGRVPGPDPGQWRAGQVAADK